MTLTKTIKLHSGKEVKQPFPKWIIPTVIAFAIFIGCSIIVLQSKGKLQMSELGTILKQLFTPITNPYGDTEQTWGTYFAYLANKEVTEALIETLEMSFVGTVIGAVLALPFAILCSTNVIRTKVVTVPVRLLINLIRTMPTMVIAVITVTIVKMGPSAGIISTAIFTFGIMTKMVYECIEALDMGSYEALLACGANKTKGFFYALFPQLLPTYVGYFVYNFEINVRTSVILGYVGAGGLGVIIQAYMQSIYTRNKVGAILILIFVIVIILQAFTRWIRGKLQ